MTRDEALATLERIADRRLDLFADETRWGLLADLFEEEARVWHAVLVDADALMAWAASSAEIAAVEQARFWRAQSEQVAAGAP